MAVKFDLRLSDPFPINGAMGEIAGVRDSKSSYSNPCVIETGPDVSKFGPVGGENEPIGTNIFRNCAFERECFRDLDVLQLTEERIELRKRVIRHTTAKPVERCERRIQDVVRQVIGQRCFIGRGGPSDNKAAEEHRHAQTRKPSSVLHKDIVNVGPFLRQAGFSVLNGLQRRSYHLLSKAGSRP